MLWSPVGKWPMSLELEASAHTQSPLPRLAQDCFPATAPCSLVSCGPPRLPICQPCPEIGSRNQVTFIGREVHIPCLPLPSALGWGLGGSVRRVRCSIKGRSKAVVIPTQSWQHYGEFRQTTEREPLTHPLSRY